MSAAAAATTSAPAGQETAPSSGTTTTQPAAGESGNTQTAPAEKPAGDGKKPPVSVLSLEDHKPAETKKDGEPDPKPGESKDPKAEAKGELDIKLPDGIEVDAAKLGEFKALAKEVGLSSEAASKLVAWNIEQLTKASRESAAAWEKQGEDWLNELQADKDFDANALAVKGLLRRSEEGRAFVDAAAKHGLGNWPPLVKLLTHLSKAIKEDNADTGSRPPPVPDKHEQLRRDYPSMYNEDGSPKR